MISLPRCRDFKSSSAAARCSRGIPAAALRSTRRISRSGRRSGGGSIRAFLRAEKFANDNHEKTLDDVSKYLKLDRALIQKAYYEGFLDQTSDPNVTGIVRFWKTTLKSGFVESDKDITQFVDTKIYEKALKQRASESPDDAFWKKCLEIFARRDSAAATAQLRRERADDPCQVDCGVNSNSCDPRQP